MALVRRNNKLYSVLLFIFASFCLVLICLWNIGSAINDAVEIVLYTDDNPVISVPHSPRYTKLHSKRKQLMSKYANRNYQCDYIHSKGAGKSGTTQLKLILSSIERRLCFETKYNESYHFEHSPYSICKDWTNGTAEYRSHAVHYNRHALHDIDDILITQQTRKEANDSIYSKYFMGYSLHKLWKQRKLRYCVFVVIRDPRNRVLSRINTFDKRANNDTMVSNEEKNKIFKQRFTKGYIEHCNHWWRKYSLLEEKNAMDWYLYFYSDFRMHTFEILKDMLWFAGYDEYINDEMIHQIINQTSIEHMQKRKNVNKGLICSFDAENSLTQKTKKYANDLMKHTLDDRLLSKFNRTCPIT